jgi:type I restriction-modification system DNA methylase subunit
MKGTYPVPPQGKETWKQLTEIARFGYSYSDIFSDFVETILAALLSLTDNMKHADFVERLKQNKLTGLYEKRYLQLVAKYQENTTRQAGERPIDFFTKAWGCLQKETYEAQADILGELYESQISLGEHGQFFTPPTIAGMLSEMLGVTSGETMHEPACGSGRLIIAAAKNSPYGHFYGIDVSPVCARMAVLNMWLFDINADIYQGNTLSMEMSYLWRIRKGGYIWEWKIDAQAPTQQQKELPQEVTEQSPEKEQPAPMKQITPAKKKRPASKGEATPLQPTLFDLDDETTM